MAAVHWDAYLHEQAEADGSGAHIAPHHAANGCKHCGGVWAGVWRMWVANVAGSAEAAVVYSSLLQACQQACLGPTTRRDAACCPASCAHNSMRSPVSGSSSGSTANFLKNSMASSLWACAAQSWHQVSLVGCLDHPAAHRTAHGIQVVGVHGKERELTQRPLGCCLPGLAWGSMPCCVTWHAAATGAAQQRTHAPTPFGLPCRRSGWPPGRDGTPTHQCRMAAPPPPGSRQRLRSNRERASGQGDWLLEVASTAG